MTILAAATIAATAEGVWSCGSGNAAGDGGSDAQTDACGASLCTQFPGACGSATDACGKTVICGLCKYDGEATGGGNYPMIGLAIGASTEVAYPGGVATRSAPGTWMSSGAPGSSTTNDVFDFAEATDGTAWIAYADSMGQLVVSHQSAAATDAGGWVTEIAVPRSTSATAIRIGSDGVPVVAYAGVASGGTGYAVSIARRSGGTWTETPVATSNMQLRAIAMALGGTDPQLAWVDIFGVVTFAHSTAPTMFVTEPLTSGLVGQPSIAIAIDAAGNAHVATGGGGVEHWTKQGGT
jgi:hypothetical protein